ncbi:heterokaryon incompatibility protein-domain-containing protein [Colletotrichum cereale]|nr:heterokaryon incompatibility protein-domain-containing protein [Colletotrichum cereale]
MRLLNADTLQPREFYDRDVPAYAILSHTWEDEVTLQDLTDPARATKKGFSKVRSCCAQAVRDGYEWVWVDTCCIDKTSSANLSKAINFMFRWYQPSSVCYAYLGDLPRQRPGDLDAYDFRFSKWFTRGWTLQELIDPALVEFYDQEWNDVGTKLSLGDLIPQITGIRRGILSGDLPLALLQRAKYCSFQSSHGRGGTKEHGSCILTKTFRKSGTYRSLTRGFRDAFQAASRTILQRL